MALYTRADKLAAIRTAAQIIQNDNLSAEQYRSVRTTHDPTMPSAELLFRDGWNTLKQEAGLPITPKKVNFGDPAFNNGELLGAFQRITNELGKKPSIRQYDELRKDGEPSSSTIRNRMGSWRSL